MNLAVIYPNTWARTNADLRLIPKAVLSLKVAALIDFRKPYIQK